MKQRYIKLSPNGSGERNSKQRYALVEAWCEHWTYCSWQKSMSWDEATLNSEEIKPIALAVIKLCLSEGVSQIVSQLVSQSVENLLNKIFLKIYNNLMQRFRADLKTFLYPMLPYCHKLNIWLVFRWDFWARNHKHMKKFSEICFTELQLHRFVQ